MVCCQSDTGLRRGIGVHTQERLGSCKGAGGGIIFYRSVGSLTATRRATSLQRGV